MWLWFILGIIILILAFILAFKIAKKVMKYLAIVVLLVLIVSGVFVYLIYKDVDDLRQNFLEKENMFILYKEDKILAGFSMKFSDFTDIQGFDESSLNYLSEDKVNEYSEFFISEEYDQILGENYKVFFIDYIIFNDMEKIEFGEDKFSNELILSILEAEDPNSIYQEELVRRGYPAELVGEQTVPEHFKAQIFILLISKKLEQDTMFLITEMKNDNIKVYPETILFKMIDYVPSDYIAEKLSGVADSLEEKVGELEGGEQPAFVE